MSDDSKATETEATSDAVTTPEAAPEAANDTAAEQTTADAAAPDANEADAQAAQASAAYARAMAQNQGNPQASAQASDAAANADAATEATAEAAKEAKEIPVNTADAAPAPAGSDDLAGQVADLKDRLLRQMAETENLRNRMKRDVEDAGKYAVAKFARDMLSVSDNLKRATDSVPEEGRDAEPLKTFYEGVMLTERELLNAMEKHQIAPINPEVGEKFDPNFHEAMFEAPVPNAPAGSVIQVMEVGYRIHDRLLRPARVGVAKAG